MDFKIVRGNYEEPFGAATFYVPINIGDRKLYFGVYGGLAKKLDFSNLVGQYGEISIPNHDDDYPIGILFLNANKNLFYSFKGDIFRANKRKNFDFISDRPEEVMERLSEDELFFQLQDEVMAYVSRWSDYEQFGISSSDNEVITPEKDIIIPKPSLDEMSDIPGWNN